jgi:hypothetical protein
MYSEDVVIDGKVGLVSGASQDCTVPGHPGYCASWKVRFPDGTSVIKDARDITWDHVAVQDARRS